MEALRGTVDSVVFQNPENGYTVLRLEAENGEPVTVVGTAVQISAGERMELTGEWGSHPSYGRQFVAQTMERLMPETAQEILRYLSARTVRGIGPATARKLVARFGDRTLDVMEREPERLAELPGISLKKAKEIGEAFRQQTGVRRLVEYLAAHGLPAELAMRLYRVFGEEAMTALQDDPYLLTDPLFHAPFGAVDAFALSVGVAGDDQRRLEAGVLFELRHNLGNGHTFLPADKLAAASVQLLDSTADAVEAAMERLGESGRMVLEQFRGLTACYLPELYAAETDVAARILDMAQRELEPPANLPRRIAEIARKTGIQYAPRQTMAISAAVQHQMLLLTGGPGTGKTTTLAGMLELLDELGISTQLAAPTGRAAKRLSELTGRDAATIHRLLEAQFSPETGEMEFCHDEANPLDCKALVVDEASMVDIALMASLLRALRKDCRLILVGDPDQLPSVGPGNVFSDLIRSGVVTTVQLTEIFRQARESLIVMNAHAVNSGQMPELNCRDRDFFLLRRQSAEQVVTTICDLCARRLPQNMGIQPWEIQVLTPSRKFATGTRALNAALQAALNPPEPGKREKKRGDFLFREGDRVMQIRNNYDILWHRLEDGGAGTGMFNGDIGRIETIDPEREEVSVVFEDRRAVYDFEMLSELELAYAMTVHKSQGSEYRAVILAAFGGTPFLLTRGVLYTAITRARSLLIAVGTEETILTMAQNNRQQKRYSGLKLRLEGAAG